jgi:CheY-like chemotaxis protein
VTGAGNKRLLPTQDLLAPLPEVDNKVERRYVICVSYGSGLIRSRQNGHVRAQSSRRHGPIRDQAVIERDDAKALARKVLVVEDDESLALLMRYNLERCAYDVDTIDCGSAADTFLTANRPDLVILDWMLPAVSGIEILRRLRARGGLGYVPVIMLTARGDRESRLRAVVNGVDVFLSKPFSVGELMSQVHRLLAHQEPLPG